MPTAEDLAESIWDTIRPEISEAIRLISLGDAAEVVGYLIEQLEMYKDGLACQ